MRTFPLSCLLLLSLLLLPLGCASNGEAGPKVKERDASQRLVGISYHTWFPPVHWNETWGRPVLGHYDSADEFTIRQHALWFLEAGVDFLILDWSNNLHAADSPELQQIEAATQKVVDVYAGFDKGPKLAFLLGIDSDPANLENGALQRKADQVYDTFIANPRYAKRMQTYQDKPLLLIYVGTPSPWQDRLPPWDDARFTVRWLTAFLSDQPALLSPQGACSLGYWSWWERTPQPYTVFEGRPESMALSAAYTGPGGWKDDAARGRRDGQTFLEQWLRVQQVDPEFVVINSWNEWYRAEEKDEEFSNDLEPSKDFQYLYHQLLQQGIAAWKAMPTAPAAPAAQPAPAPTEGGEQKP